MKHASRRIELLEERLQKRLRKDGTPMPGFEQNVASIRAELAALAAAEQKGAE